MLQRRLGVLDLTLITIGAVIGSGIFRTPAIVAQHAHSTPLILLCWLIGGIMAIIGAFVFAELAARRPADVGIYAYLRDAFHPLVGFLLAWSALTMTYVGSTAAAAALFAAYLLPLVGLHFDPRIVAVTAIAIVTLINVLGVRQGGTWQNILVALKVFGIAAVIVTGVLIAHPLPSELPAFSPFMTPGSAIAAIGIAMLPVLFSYNNFQAATLVASETVDPGRTIPLGQIIGMLVVLATYLLASIAYLHVLSAPALAHSSTPASDVMRAAFGAPGAAVVAAVIAISTLGFMSNAVLLAPRLYFQMADDGLFFKQFAWVSPKARVPVVAIAVHGAIAAIIAASGTYEQILNWISLWPWIFIGLAACAVFIFRRRDAGLPRPAFVVPLHPWSTVLLIATIAAISIAVVVQAPLDTLYGTIVMIAGILFYSIWKAVHARTAA